VGWLPLGIFRGRVGKRKITKNKKQITTITAKFGFFGLALDISSTKI
jgi:hypothetical protein